ncbi:histidinol-phosphate transaminase [Paraglaciecola arctica]|uniref:Histidinol-phosphate aminotransferase n=1 Tax=Paraglaciecola arctica BSs20135 TaxID=493475 RepID=K6Z2Y7_9ALTE|nr:histidinol-phosphate transaminase [Paraglaciecola arctica]GAC17785.1 histidinol-phosphate aminotransferase [Paraglaciecola arctica BSs20135]
MSDLVNKLICENLKALKPYESARRIFAGGDSDSETWLNANESPFANDFTIDTAHFNRYPDCQPPSVLLPYAKYAGVQANQLLVSRGADEGIELLIRTFCTPGKDSILICPPTYGMYAISAETSNVAIEKAPLKADFSLDIPAIFAYQGKVNLVFICSPNNPTGTSVGKAQLKQVLEHFADSALVVVDEAYIEFDADNTWATELAAYPNLVILRTLSKAFALAGLRCGFTLANSEVIQSIMKVIAPYPIADPVAQIAAQALSPNGLKQMAEQVEYLSQQKQWVKQQLNQFPELELVGDDKANFILFRYSKKQGLMDFLVANSVLIRDQSKQINLDNCLRITLGTQLQNEKLLALMASFFKQQETSA